jgi:hypothetical protein
VARLVASCTERPDNFDCESFDEIEFADEVTPRLWIRIRPSHPLSLDQNPGCTESTKSDFHAQAAACDSEKGPSKWPVRRRGAIFLTSIRLRA